MSDELSFPLPEQSQTIGAVIGSEEGFKINPDVDNLHLAFYRLVPTEVGKQGGESRQEGSGRQGNPKQQYLRALAEHWEEEILEKWDQSSSPITAVRQRMSAQLESLASDGRATRFLDLETEGRLVAGLGYDSPMEVGLSLHPLHGFPYLPGSSVKGVARTYAERIEEASPDALLQVFGSTSLSGSDPERRKGRVTFMDAIPASEPRLELDVMTPHYGDYYTDGGETPPGNWHDPTPVPFLAVAGGTSFRFPLVAENEELLEQAASWLEKGLFWVGAGGKTSSGYGLFTSKKRRQEAEQQRQQRRIEKELPPKKESISKSTTGIIAEVWGPTGYDYMQEAKLDVILHVEGYEEVRVPMTGSEINVERFDADWVEVRVDEFFGQDDQIPLVRYESKWRP